MADNDKISKTAQKKPLCFVVGPIGKDGTSERKHSDLLLNAVIKQVLQQDEFGYAVKRADEDADPGMIGDRVVSDIINAELVVADLTDLNANAFYELGIRHSTEKPTIHVAKTGTLLPFDNIAHRTIFIDLTDWYSIEQARGRLAESARTISSPGYKVSNPITQANASFKMRQSEDPRDRVLAGMQERLGSLEVTFAAQKATGRPQRTATSGPFRSEEAVFDNLHQLAITYRSKKLSDSEIVQRLLREMSTGMSEKPLNIEFNDKGYLMVEFANIIFEGKMT